MGRTGKFTEPTALIQERVPQSIKTKVLNFIKDESEPFLLPISSKELKNIEVDQSETISDDQKSNKKAKI